MTTIQQKITTAFPDLACKFDEPLAPYTYMKIGGPAEVLVTIKDLQTISAFIAFCREEFIPFRILGGASDVLVSDEGIQGVVIFMAIDTFESLEKTEGPYHFVRAGAGMKMAPLVAKTVSLGLTGPEYFLGVPGTLGGAIYNNAHYLTDLIGAHVHTVQVLSSDGSQTTIPVEECEFAYEQSRFQNTDEVIVSAEFKLKKGDPLESQNLIAHATQYRANTQPLGVPSSGCIFQNVPNTPELKKTFPKFADKPFVPGGYIIDQAGLKGTKVGAISVSQKHAAWFENAGKGTCADVKALIKKVKDTVQSQFDVELHEEVFYIE